MNKLSQQFIKSVRKSVKARTAYEDKLPRVKDLSHRIRSDAKRAITAVRLGKADEYDKLIKEAVSDLKSLAVLARGDAGSLMSEGFVREALEEYAEALIFQAIVSNKAPELPPEVTNSPDILLSALCDAVGEILRMAVVYVDKESARELENYHAIIETLSMEIIPVAHGGKLRQKYDEMERNLKRLEGMIYDLKVKSR